MLGEKISEGNGKVISQRVIQSDIGPKMETSFSDEGTLLGVKCRGNGTYCAELRADGTLFGEGQGIIMGENGETATWRGQGVGIMQQGGGVKFRGAIYYQSRSEKFLRLNQISGVYEHDVDKDGNTMGSTWEWR
jgi:hypothetical protein